MPGWRDRIGQLPVKAPKRPGGSSGGRFILIVSEQGVASRRRPDKGLLAGLWEYPNELAEEGAIPALLGLEQGGAGARRTGAGIFFTHIEWRMQAWTARIPAEALPESWVWADRQALARDYACPTRFQAFRDFVDRQLGYF